MPGPGSSPRQAPDVTHQGKVLEPSHDPLVHDIEFDDRPPRVGTVGEGVRLNDEHARLGDVGAPARSTERTELRASDLEPTLGPDLCRAVQLLQASEERCLGLGAGVPVEGLGCEEQAQVGARVLHRGRRSDELGERRGIALVGRPLSRACAEDRRRGAQEHCCSCRRE